MEKNALTVRELIEELTRQDPDLKVKLGYRWITKTKYRNCSGKSHIELITSE